MQNDYFNHDVPLARHTLARAESLNDIFYSLQAGFAKIPDVARVKDGRIVYGTDSGTANFYQVALPQPRTQLTDGMQVVFRAQYANTGQSTLNLDGLGAVALIRLDGQDLVAGDIQENGFVECRYHGPSTKWVLTSHSLRDVVRGETARIGAEVAQAAAEAAKDSANLEANRAEQEANRAEQEANRATSGAGLQNPPPISPNQSGEALTVNANGDGYVTTSINAMMA